MPVEVTNAQSATPGAVDRSQEENELALPLLGDEVRASEQVVEQVDVEGCPLRQLLAELVTLDILAILLLLGEIQRDLGGIPLEYSALAVLLDRPSVRDERIGVEIDEVIRGDDLGVAEQDFAEVPHRLLAVGELRPLVCCPPRLPAGDDHFMDEAVVTAKVGHTACHSNTPLFAFCASGPNRIFGFAVAEKARWLGSFCYGRRTFCKVPS